MNAFEPLFWMGCAFLFICIVKTGNQTVDLVWHPRGIGPRKQVLDADILSRHCLRLALDFAAQLACQPVALDRRGDRVWERDQ